MVTGELIIFDLFKKYVKIISTNKPNSPKLKIKIKSRIKINE
jgi:hypothetical protein